MRTIGWQEVIALRLFLAVSTAFAQTRDIWISGIDAYSRARLSPGIESDFSSMLNSNSYWPETSKVITHFSITQRYIFEASDNELSFVIGAVRRHNMKLAVGILALPRDRECGRQVEGYSAPGSVAYIARKIARLGGRIDTVIMDEPLWFGHHYGGQGACADTIASVATSAAKSVMELRAIFPRAEVVDVEPVNSRGGFAFNKEMIQFSSFFYRSSGTRISAVIADVGWHSEWQKVLANMFDQLKKHGIETGIIYNGDGADSTDVQWEDRAEDHFKSVEKSLGFTPDIVSFQSWTRHPYHMIPEWSGGTLTNLVLRYCCLIRRTRDRP